jgi:cobalt-zinc-cadmium efflux system outer membrane protein
MRIVRIFILLFLGFTGSVPAHSQEREEMQWLILEAMSNNPEIAAELQKMKMFEERIPQAGALEDPQFIYKLMEFPGLQFGKAVYQNFELMQIVMFPTKLSLRKDIARLKAEHAHHEHLEKVLDVVARVKSSFAMVWAARTNIEINEEIVRLLEQILEAAQTRSAVGKASQQDVLKTNIELIKTKTNVASLREEVRSSESMLRALLNRPSKAEIGTIDPGPFRRLGVSLEDLLTFARHNRPMLVHDSLSVVEGSYLVSVARQEYVPDLRFSLERVTMPEMGVKTWTVMAGITIPFAPWTLAKASARVEEARADRAMRESMFLASRNMVEARVREAYAKVKALETQVVALDSTIVPQSYQSLLSLLTEYQTGTTSFIMLLDSYRMYQDMRMEATMVRMNYEIALSQLERQVGIVDLWAIPSSEKENKR